MARLISAAKRALGAVVAAAAVAMLAAAMGTAGADAQTATSGPVPAPIERVEIAMQWNAVVTSGLPSGCAQFHSISVQRAGTRFDVTVLNTMNIPPSGACTAIYGTTTNSVRLAGAELAPATTYTVVVNGNTAGGKQTTFTTPSAGGATQPPAAAPRPAKTGNAGLLEEHREPGIALAAPLAGGIAALVLVRRARLAIARR